MTTHMQPDGRITTAATDNPMTPPRAWLKPDTTLPGVGTWTAENTGSAEMAGAVEYVPADQWQDISTAPHGEIVLLGWWTPDGLGNSNWDCEVACASWGWRTGSISNMSRHGQATHWMPLPAPPSKETPMTDLIARLEGLAANMRGALVDGAETPAEVAAEITRLRARIAAADAMAEAVQWRRNMPRSLDAGIELDYALSAYKGSHDD